MRAVGVVPEQKQVRIFENHPAPSISSPEQVLIQTLDVGICGTDREICTFVYGTPPPGSDYLVLGHEAVGRVLDVGHAVQQVSVGDLVVPSVRRPCPDANCQPCAQGLQDFCQTGTFTERGIGGCHGYMTESFVESETYLTKVPPELRHLAVLAEPLTIAEKGIEEAFKVQARLPWAHRESGRLRGEGRNAVILGCGPIGILGAMKCVIEGFKTIVYSRSRKPNPKAALVESIGVEYISSLDASPDDLVEHVGRIDLVYEAVGITSVSFDVLERLGINGIYVFTGIPDPASVIEINAGVLMRNLVLKNQAVIGTVNADPQAFADAIRDLGIFQNRWPEAINGVITGHFEPEDFEDLLVGKAQGIKNVIRFGGMH